MTAATLTKPALREVLLDTLEDATATPSEIVTRGGNAYRNAMNAVWPKSVRRHVGHAAMDLHEALRMYSLTLSEDAASGVAEATDALIRVFPGCAGIEGGQ